VISVSSNDENNMNSTKKIAQQFALRQSMAVDCSYQQTYTSYQDCSKAIIPPVDMRQSQAWH
jgi:hypothetical protein